MKTTCIFCMQHLHLDCSKCNLPEEMRYKTHEPKPATTLDKLIGMHGGFKRIAK